METTQNVKIQRTDSRSTAMDVSLFKVIGLYQLLQPFTDGGELGIVRRYRRIILAVLLLSVGLLCLQIVRLYLLLSDMQLFVYMFMIYSTWPLCMFKMYVLVTNADRLWALLEIGQFGFTAYGRREPKRMIQCPVTLSAILRLYVVSCFITETMWIISPWFVKDYESLVKLDGTVGHYRPSVLINWYPLSESVYNWPPIWGLIYIVEAIACMLNMISLVLFDCYLMTVCMGLVSQFATMFTAYETLGRRCPNPDTSASSDIQKESEYMEIYNYDELIVYIQDNKKITMMCDEFFDIIRPVVIAQIFMGSLSMITAIGSAILFSKSGMSMLSAPMIKLYSSYLSFCAQTFIYCYSFQRVEAEKSTMNFGLYSSNWTEMNLKFKKTLLLVMNMNSAHNRVMRRSPKLIVNMVMFTSIMRTSYSIVSVFLNL